MKKISISRNIADYKVCDHIKIGAEEDPNCTFEYTSYLKIYCEKCNKDYEFEVMI